MAALYSAAVKGIEGDFSTLQKALELQDRVARADFTIVKAGIAGTKHALDCFVSRGLGGVCRLPLGPVTGAVREMIEIQLAGDWQFEQSL